jgi:hypothetical protein
VQANAAIIRQDLVSAFDAMPSEQAAYLRDVFAVLRRLFPSGDKPQRYRVQPHEGMETPPAVKARERWLVAIQANRAADAKLTANSSQIS